MKWLKWLARIALALVVVAIIAVAYLPWILDRVIDSRLSHIRMQGHPTSTSDLGKPTIYPLENAATVYAEAFKTISDADADQDFDTVSSFLSRASRAQSPSLWDKAGRVVSNHRTALVLAEKAASRPACRFTANWEDGPLELQFRYLGMVRRLTSLAAAAAVLDARDGRMERAMARIMLAYRTGESLKDEPTLIGQLARAECLSTSSRALQDLASYGGIGEAQAKELYDFLSGIDTYSGFVKALAGERAMGLDMLEGVRKSDPLIVHAVLDNRANSSSTSPGPKRSWTYLVRASDDELYYIRYMHDQILSAQLPYRMIRPDLRASQSPFPIYALGSSILCPPFAQSSCHRDEATARVAGDRIYTALLAFRDLYGSYPRSLGELDRRLCWPLPKDPFSDRSFIYKRHGGGFLFYGIGRNLQDDGGKAYPSSVVSPEQQEQFPYQTFTGLLSADMMWQRDR